MAYPNFPNKQSEISLFLPQDVVKISSLYKNIAPEDLPQKNILLYHHAQLEFLKKQYQIKKLNPSYSALEVKGQNIGIYQMRGIGAPNAVTFFEELIALGGREFINLGIAGGLQQEQNFGDIIVCDRAIRDEGTSHHYLNTEKYAYPSQILTEKVKRQLEQQNIPFKIGVSWTIDAPYRETLAEIDSYRKEGVQTVEMEAAALFAVAQFRKVDLAAMFTISDLLTNSKWKPKFSSSKVKNGLNMLITTAIQVLANDSLK